MSLINEALKQARAEDPKSAVPPPLGQPVYARPAPPVRREVRKEIVVMAIFFALLLAALAGGVVLLGLKVRQARAADAAPAVVSVPATDAVPAPAAAAVAATTAAATATAATPAAGTPQSGLGKAWRTAQDTLHKKAEFDRQTGDNPVTAPLPTAAGPTPVPPPAVPTPPALAVPTPVTASFVSPAPPAPPAAGTPAPAAPTEIKLTAILGSTKTRIAIINSRALRVGDKLAGVGEVIAIEESRVVLKTPKGSQELHLPDLP